MYANDGNEMHLQVHDLKSKLKKCNLELKKKSLHIQTLNGLFYFVQDKQKLEDLIQKNNELKLELEAFKQNESNQKNNNIKSPKDEQTESLHDIQNLELQVLDLKFQNSELRDHLKQQSIAYEIHMNQSLTENKRIDEMYQMEVHQREKLQELLSGIQAREASVADEMEMLEVCPDYSFRAYSK